MRRTLPVVAAFALLVLLGGCVGALGADDGNQAQSQAQSVDNQTIEVGASGQVSTQPDQAVVRVGVEARGPDAATARQRLAENVSTLRDGLAEIETARVTTSGYDIRQDHRRHRDDPEADPAYVARQTFTVTLNDTERAGEVIDTAVESGATSVDGVRFTLSDDRRDELEEQALEAAMDRARTKADTMASRANLTITGVQTATTVERGYRPYEHEATAAAGDGASTSIDSGPVSVTAQVQVVYEAQDSA